MFTAGLRAGPETARAVAEEVFGASAVGAVRGEHTFDEPDGPLQHARDDRARALADKLRERAARELDRARADRIGDDEDGQEPPPA
ncbi:hypothetical protein Nans01_23030 [Nocardiopsis ansamitocini]|uniref:Uncharacterized protein n=2 Tax=Nocardiopsis ansamitocini TaxID=1670832 RepID=A0A9W6P6G5_9ACTN|nr:hypothetical protein Nans01_23030 [Nocardiopsis ansamitocini]